MEGHVFRKKMKTPHPQFGTLPRRLPGSQLPTNGDVIGRIQMIRIERMQAASVIDERQVPIHGCIQVVVDEILELWKRASLPVSKHPNVAAAVRNLWGRKDAIKKKSGKTQQAARERLVRATMSDIDKLFDIASRNCQPELPKDRAFLADQRGPRLLHIGGLDAGTTALW